MAHTQILSKAIDDVMAPSGGIDPELLAKSLKITMVELASITGLHRNTIARNPQSPKVQQKLSEITAILADVAELMGGNVARARTWFVGQPLTGFGGKTPADIVKLGRPDAVHWHLELLRDGTYS